MKAYLQKKTTGFYLTVVAMVLAVVGLFYYSAAENKVSTVFVLTGAAIAVEILLLVVSFFAGNRAVFNLASSVSAVLMALAVSISFNSQLDAIGYVVSGLYPTEKIMNFAVFVVLAVLSLLLYCIASFTNLGKQD